jgi:hypothetical protein
VEQMGNCQTNMVRVDGEGCFSAKVDRKEGSPALLPPSDRRFEDPTRDVSVEGALAFANHSTMWGTGRRRIAKEMHSIWGEVGPPLHLVEHQGKLVRFRESLESDAQDESDREGEEGEKGRRVGVVKLLSLGIPRRDPKCVQRLIWRNDTVFPIRYEKRERGFINTFNNLTDAYYSYY